MTKTQIEAVARALKRSARRTPDMTSAERLQHKICCIEVAEALRRTRKGFDCERFLKDCGVIT